jgi:lysozyme
MIRKGIDISHYQRVYSWLQVSDQVSFAYHKASEGHYSDPKFKEHLMGAREQALSVGGYHFYRPDVSPDIQLRTFHTQLESIYLGDGDLVPALDAEREPPLVFTPEIYVPGMTRVVRGIIKEWGKCVIYCSQHDWSTLGNPEILLDPDVYLWVAHYTPKEAPAVPMGKPWTMWQHSGSGTCPGVYSPQGVDLDVATVLPVLGRNQYPDDALATVAESLRAEIESAWEQGTLHAS